MLSTFILPVVVSIVIPETVVPVCVNVVVLEEPLIIGRAPRKVSFAITLVGKVNAVAVELN